MDKLLSLQGTMDHINNLKIARAIKQIHIHNTASPAHKDFTGNNHLQLQQGMRYYHVNKNGWQDIGQHLTLFPDGFFVTGRSFDEDPASIKGWNEGAVCIEMLGHFNVGKDPFKGPQAESAFRICGVLMKKFNLTIDGIKFHRENPLAGNTECPGTAIDKAWFLSEVAARYESMFPAKNPVNTGQTEEQWKLDGIRILHEAGILNDINYWSKHINDNAPVYLVTTLMSRIYMKLKEDANGSKQV